MEREKAGAGEEVKISKISLNVARDPGVAMGPFARMSVFVSMEVRQLPSEQF